MICPKCQNLMKVVDKDGIHIDQCEGCGGVFLDRGELEQAVQAENAFYANAAPPAYRPEGPPAGGYAPPPPPPAQPVPPNVMRPYADAPRDYRGGYADSPRPYRGGYADSPRPYRGGYRDAHYGKRRKRGGFLENLLDFD